MTIFIAGGSGYIGKHIVDFLQKENVPVCILDNKFPDFKLEPRTSYVDIDLAGEDSAQKLSDIFSQSENNSCLIHLAGKKSVEESFLDPDLYFKSNVVTTDNLLLAMKDSPVSKIIFASTAAVYGNIDYSRKVTEDAVCHPISPYASSKLKAESHILASGYRVAILRFFNVAGAVNQEFIELTGSNLIPASINNIKTGLGINIFGNDYGTPDGTCIRDYSHIQDLVEAMIESMKVLNDENVGIINIGSGEGYSVLQIVSEIQKNSKYKVEINYLPRRDGDVEQIVADTEKATKMLNWNPRRGISEMVLSSIPISFRRTIDF